MVAIIAVIVMVCIIMSNVVVHRRRIREMQKALQEISTLAAEGAMLLTDTVKQLNLSEIEIVELNAQVEIYRDLWIAGMENNEPHNRQN